jgi:hypothetical protein
MINIPFNGSPLSWNPLERKERDIFLANTMGGRCAAHKKKTIRTVSICNH